MNEKFADKTSIFSEVQIVRPVEFYINDFLEALAGTPLNNFIVKGCMALKYSMSYKYMDEFRATNDLDLHIFSKDDWEVFVSSCCKVATTKSKSRVTYTLEKRRGFTKNPKGDRLIIKANSAIFTIDMNIGSDVDFCHNEDTGLRFYSLPSILSDKLHVLSTQKVCRRIKDLIDVYFIATNFDMGYHRVSRLVKERLISTNRIIDPRGIYIYNPNTFSNLEHAFSKYSESIQTGKSFEEVLDVVQGFTLPIYSLVNGDMFNYTSWSKDVLKWV